MSGNGPSDASRAQADAAARAASDPRTEPWILADIAYRYPELRAQLLANPSTYPGLRGWILAQAHSPAVRTPLQSSANAHPPSVIAAALPSSTPVPTGSTAQPPNSKRLGASPLVALAVAVGILIIGVLIVTATVVADGVVNVAKSAGTSQGGSGAPGNSGAPSSSPPGDPYAPAQGEAVFASTAASDAFFTAQQASGFGRAGQGAVTISSAGESSAVLAQSWASQAAHPADTTCRFAASTVPVFGDEKAAAADETVATASDVVKLATSSTVSQSARVFANAAEAGAYISRLKGAVPACTDLEVGDARGTVSPDVAGTITPHAAWIVDGSFVGTPGTLYVLDMRHDNLVLRTEIFVAAGDDAAVSAPVIRGIQDRAEQDLIDIKP